MNNKNVESLTNILRVSGATKSQISNLGMQTQGHQKAA